MEIMEIKLKMEKRSADNVPFTTNWQRKATQTCGAEREYFFSPFYDLLDMITDANCYDLAFPYRIRRYLFSYT